MIHKKYSKTIFGLIFLVSYLIIIFSSSNEFFNALNLRLFDVLSCKINYNKTKNIKNSDNKKIIIINIDEEFTRKVGKYPLPRNYYAYLISKLRKFNPKSIGISVVFAEKKKNSNLAEYMDKDIVLGSYFDYKTNTEVIPERKFLKKMKMNNVGLLNVSLDNDGVLRKIKPFYKLNNKNRYHFIIKLLKNAYPNFVNLDNPKKISLNYKSGKKINLDENFFLNFTPRISNNIIEINYMDFFKNINSEKFTDNIRNNIVLIGVNSPNISSYWISMGLKKFSSNYILASGMLTLENGFLLKTTSLAVNQGIILCLTLIIFFFILENLTSPLTKNKKIIFPILLFFIFLTPLALYKYFYLYLNFFNIYFSIFTITTILLLLRFYLYLINSRENINSLNIDLNNKLISIQELNKIQNKSILEIEKLKNEINETESTVFNNKNFYKDLSHEINNKITPALLANQIINVKNKNKDYSGLTNLLNSSSDNIREISVLLKKIKIINNLETEKKILFKKNDILKLLFETKQSFIKNEKILDPECSIKIYIISDFLSVIIKCDRILIGQIFYNIISNSFKYCIPEKGCEIKITLLKNDNSIKIIFEDFGTGIEPENENKINDRFFRENRDLNIAGEGIGLSIVNKIIKIHNGKITYKNKGINKGLITEIELPLE